MKVEPEMGLPPEFQKVDWLDEFLNRSQKKWLIFYLISPVIGIVILNIGPLWFPEILQFLLGAALALLFAPILILVDFYNWMEAWHDMIHEPQEDRFPSCTLERALRKLSLLKNDEGGPRFSYSSEHQDVTLESKDLIVRFMPYIQIQGFGLKFERRLVGRYAIWGGVFARVLQNSNDAKERCLQYIFVYTRQFSSISPIYWTLCPWLLVLAIRLVIIANVDFLLVIIGALGLPGLAVITHLIDPVNKKRVHPATPLIFYWLFLLFGYFSWIIPETILFWWGIFFLGVWFLDIIESRLGRLRVFRTGHPMDYIPIFVWVKLIDTQWVISKVSWDEWHYEAKTRTVDEIKPSHIMDHRRVRFVLDNPWHSLRLGNPLRHSWIYGISGVGFFILYYLTNGQTPLTFSPLFAILFCWILVGLFYSSFHGSGKLLRLFEKSYRNIIDSKNETTSDQIDYLLRLGLIQHLNDSSTVTGVWSNLHVLWNLRRPGADMEKEGPRFVVESKMQQPFGYEKCIGTFRNDE